MNTPNTTKAQQRIEHGDGYEDDHVIDQTIDAMIDDIEPNPLTDVLPHIDRLGREQAAGLNKLSHYIDTFHALHTNAADPAVKGAFFRMHKAALVEQAQLIQATHRGEGGSVAGKIGGGS